MLHFFNVSPNITEENISSMLLKCGLTRPQKITKWAKAGALLTFYFSTRFLV
jgi:hypothetical protein